MDKCIVCGNKVKRKGNKFCSKKCSGKERKEHELGKCKICGENVNRWYNKYCSRKCAACDCERLKKISESLKLKKIIPPSRKGIPGHCKGKIGFRHSGSFKKGKEHWNYSGRRPEDIMENKWQREMFRKHISPDVIKRDGYRCIVCGEVGGYLHAHHIKSWKIYPDERFNIDNCVTVHRGKCHIKRERIDSGYWGRPHG
jgi:endogenous inhibitor of DNA gyrase (YacG/DUF329 family)